MADSTITNSASEPTTTVALPVVVRRVRLGGRSPQGGSSESSEPGFTRTTTNIWIWGKPSTTTSSEPTRTSLDPADENVRLAPSATQAGYVVGAIAGILAIVLAGYLVIRGRKHGWKRMFPCCVLGGDPRRKKRKQKEKEQMQSDLEAASLTPSNRPPSTLGKYKQQIHSGSGNKNEFEMSEKMRNGGGSLDNGDPFASTSTRGGYGDGGAYDGGALPPFVPGRGNAGGAGANDWENLPDFPGMEPSDKKGKGVVKGGYEALPSFAQDGTSSLPRGRHESALPAFIPGQSNPSYDDNSFSPDKGAGSTPLGMQLGVLPEFVSNHGSKKQHSPPMPTRKGGSELARPPQRKRRPVKEGPRDPYDIDDILDDDNYDEEDLEEFEDSVVGKPGPSGAKRTNSDYDDSYAPKPSVSSKALPTPPPPRSPLAQPNQPTVAIHSPASPGLPGEDFHGTMSSVLSPPNAPFLSADSRRDSEASSLITSRASYNENPFNPPEIPPPFVPPKDDLHRNVSNKTHIRNNPSISTFQSIESTSGVSFSTGVGRARSNSGNSVTSSVRVSPIPPTLPELPQMPDLSSSQYFTSARQPSTKRKNSNGEKRTIGTRTPPSPPPVQTPSAQRVIYSDQKDYEAIPIAMPEMPEIAAAASLDRSRSYSRKVSGNRSRSSSSGSSNGPSGPLLTLPNAAPLPEPPSGVYEMPDSMPYTPQYYFSPSQKYPAAPPPPPQPYPHMYPVPPTIPSTHGQAIRKQSPSMITDRQSVLSTAQDNRASQQVQLPTFHQHTHSLSSSTFQQEPPLSEREFLHTPPLPQGLQPTPFTSASSAKEDELARYAARKRERMAKLRGIDEGSIPVSPHRARTFAAPPLVDSFQGSHQHIQRSNTSGTSQWDGTMNSRQRGGSVAKEWNEGW